MAQRLMPERATSLDQSTRVVTPYLLRPIRAIERSEMKSVIRIVLPLVLVAAAGTGAALATTASAGSKATVLAAKSASLGTVLVDSSGRTLYRYTPDTKGHSTCTGQCLAFWPALLVKTSAKPVAGTGVKASLLGTIKAAHGMRQVTYAGYPLYRFKADSKAGEFEGQGKDGSWYVVNTSGGLVKKAASSSGGAGTSTTSGTTTDSGGGGSAWG